MRDLPDELRDLAAEQRQLVTRRQLRRSGISDSSMRAAFKREWQLVLPGVVALFTGQLTTDQRLTAAALYAGGDAVLTGPKAAEMHGVTSTWIHDYPYYRFIVPESRTDRSSGFAVARRTERPERHPRPMRGVQVVSAARAVGDAARVCRSPRDARQLAISALQSRVVSEEQLYAEATRGPIQHGKALRQGVRDFAAGAWSIAEVDVQELLTSSTILPAAMYNPLLTTERGTILPTPDAWLDDVGMAIPLHSRQFHAGDLDWNETVMQDRRLTEQGITVAPITPEKARAEPDETLRHLERTYLAELRRGHRPPVIATERHWLDVPRRTA